MAVGGVNEKNIADYFNCGADTVAFGAGIFNLKWMEDFRFDLIEQKMNSLIDSYKILSLR